MIVAFLDSCLEVEKRRVPVGLELLLHFAHHLRYQNLAFVINETFLRIGDIVLKLMAKTLELRFVVADVKLEGTVTDSAVVEGHDSDFLGGVSFSTVAH